MMQVTDSERQPPHLAPSTVSRMTEVVIKQAQVLHLLNTLDTSIAVGPDKVSPRLLCSCADLRTRLLLLLLAPPLTCLFQLCLVQEIWPSLWKKVDFVPVHKKKSRSVVGKGRSASDLLLNLCTKWHQSLDESKISCVVALDKAGAFDRVWQSGLVMKLQALGIAGSILVLLNDYLQERTQWSRIR
ncbi:uncharacterized protein [Procambarus clarkii]|uniref:uncharacterized protein n=1 Tax=Procambarus clarkii TaxID=6728 RepID=UPI003743EC8D